MSFVPSELTKITEGMMETFKYQHPHEINLGYCWMWAVLAYRKIPESFLCDLVFWTKDEKTGKKGRVRFGHAFLQYNGKYYDSESLEGKDSWRELPFFVREIHMLNNPDILPIFRRRRTFEKFIEDWKYWYESARPSVELLEDKLSGNTNPRPYDNRYGTILTLKV